MRDKLISVLLVEDNDLVKKISVIILEQLYCQVEAVATGSLAIECASKRLYDIILMDIALPDISGLNVIHCIRNMVSNQQVPIIALTAYSDQAYREQSLKAGANAYLMKPLSYEIGQVILTQYCCMK